MRVILSTVTAFLILAASVGGQMTDYSLFSYSYFIPEVKLNDRSNALQASLFPNMYENRSARQDIRWLAENDSTILAFWQNNGETILHIMRELSGIPWQETRFDVYLVRYYPTIGSSDPVIIPIGGVGKGPAFEAMPTGNELVLDLAFQLAKRMLAQSNQPEAGVQLSIAYHPLMRPGPYRCDNLAMLLAVATCDNVIGVDSTREALDSPFWTRHTPGRRILKEYLLDQWILSPERPLADWLAAEPYGSRLVVLTRPPRYSKTEQPSEKVFIDGLPLEGKLGFSVSMDESGCLTADRIDVYRLAYACGLREGDRIHRVNGKRVKTHRELVEQILGGLESGGATVEITRDGKLDVVLVRPFEVSEDDDYYDFPMGPKQDFTPQNDSVSIDEQSD